MALAGPAAQAGFSSQSWKAVGTVFASANVTISNASALREQRARELVVERVARLVRGVLPDQRMAEQIQVADGVEHLVAHELVVVAQALAVQHAELVQHDGVLQAAAQAEAGGAHRLDVLHEAEGAGARHFLHVRVAREVDHHVPVLGAEHRMREVDGEVEA